MLVQTKQVRSDLAKKTIQSPVYKLVHKKEESLQSIFKMQNFFCFEPINQLFASSKQVRVHLLQCMKKVIFFLLSIPKINTWNFLKLLKILRSIPRCQFHQHFTYEFFVRRSFFYVHVTRKSCQNTTFVQKFVRLTLMKLTPDGFRQREISPKKRLSKLRRSRMQKD